MGVVAFFLGCGKKRAAVRIIPQHDLNLGRTPMKTLFATGLIIVTFATGALAQQQPRRVSNEPQSGSLNCGQNVNVKVPKNVCSSGTMVVTGACGKGGSRVRTCS